MEVSMNRNTNSGKIENQLNLALDMPPAAREKSIGLNVGYTPQTNSWELIVQYVGSLDRVKQDLGVSIVELTGGYAILTAPENMIDRLAQYEEIIFIEKPKRLSYDVNQGRAASCINPLQTSNNNLFGQGVLVGVIDSGIDYSHPDFRNEDGTTRIEAMWDQTVTGSPPEGFDRGTLYTRDQINQALKTPMPDRMNIVQTTDLSGHGTHVTGIATGNGRASNGQYRGVASQCDLLIVKMGTSIHESFPSTTQLMEGLDFMIRRATALQKPLAINVSFGNNYGSHTGNSILENYLNEASNRWKTSIAIGTGNEGATGNHAQGNVVAGTNSV
ncbi:MAG TPA: S8 family serine peptidase, partial [Mobilitalea sp.]|nr:S8 family serine peptidase [Mobilitalea sp.]